MSLERSAPHASRKWSLRATWGEVAFAGLLVAVASGIPLSVAFGVSKAYDSLAVLLLTNPAAAFSRNVHYWSAQLFLVLTLAHAWDHLRRGTETRPRRGAWLRVTLTIPLAGFLMLSGFMLKGDVEAQQAARILAATLQQIPLAGHTLSLFLLGTAADREILYVHHVASATLLTWLFVAEHARFFWPRPVATLETFVATALASVVLSPALHDGLDPLVKGPWYFLGLQEILHWLSRPPLIMLAGVAVLLLVAALPRVSPRAARASKWTLAGTLAVYAALTVVGLFFRGDAWSWGFAWRNGASGLLAHSPAAWWAAPLGAVEKQPVPVVLGRREGCLFCHAGVKGLSAAHGAEAAGCSSCHGGNPFSLHAPSAHAAMLRVPGNLADAQRSCGTGACHPGIPARVGRSIMNTMAGVIAVDRAVFGGGGRGAGGGEATPPAVETLAKTGADSHLRQLCASCHLGTEKTEWGPVRETTRGGGCNACHLTYSDEARLELRRPNTLHRLHPNLSIAVGAQHCFGCHSRSGRISTSYEGWMELESVDSGESGHSTRSERPAQSAHKPNARTLEDGRTFLFVQADIHAEKGMECVDCHTSREVMGDGVAHARKWQAVQVACEDCHVAGTPRTVALEQLDAESLKIARLRKLDQPGARFLATAGAPLLNTGVRQAPQGREEPWLVAKSRGERLELRPPAAVCVQGGGHARLSCVSCHSAWAPRCTGCHTRFDPAGEGIDLLDGTRTKGDWLERASGFSAMPPTLGVRIAPLGTPNSALGTGHSALAVIDTFIPGMVLTIDRNQLAGGKPDNVFRRLYARAFSHTISRGARSCSSCHSDPVALGYGEGELVYESQAGRWRFAPRRPPGPDGLPADAWIGFLQERLVGTSTRADVRPFSVEEQKRILTVGACLTCHEASSREMRSAVKDWRGTVARATPSCRLPKW